MLRSDAPRQQRRGQSPDRRRTSGAAGPAPTLRRRRWWFGGRYGDSPASAKAESDCEGGAAAGTAGDLRLQPITEDGQDAAEKSTARRRKPDAEAAADTGRCDAGLPSSISREPWFRGLLGGVCRDASVAPVAHGRLRGRGELGRGRFALRPLSGAPNMPARRVGG